MSWPRSLQRRERAAIAGLALATVALYACSTIGVPYFTKGEPREALVMQTLLADGSLVLPLRNGDEIASKPPMFHWLGALASLPAGEVSEFSSRLPSVAASAVAVAVTAWLGMRLFTLASGLASGVLLMTLGLWMSTSVIARVDMVLAAFITTALASFFARYHLGRQALSHVFWAACAGAVLTKGPVGVILPGAIIGVYLLLRRDLGYIARMRPGLALAWLALPLLWYVLGALEGGQPFLNKLLLEENFARVANAEVARMGHVKPFWAHVPLLFVGTVPWCLMLPAVLIYYRRYGGDEPEGVVSFLLLWIAVPLALYSLAGSKRAVYMLPVYPAIAMLIGRWWARALVEPAVLEATGPRLVRRSLAAVAFVMGLPAVLVLFQALGVNAMAVVHPILAPADSANLEAIVASIGGHRFAVIAWSLLTCGLAVLVVRLGEERRLAVAACSVALLAVGYIGGSVLFLGPMARSQSIAPFVREVVATHGRGRGGYLLGHRLYDAAFYAGHAMPFVDTLAQAQLRGGSQAFLLLAQERDMAAQIGVGGGHQAAAAAATAGYDLREVARFSYDDNPRRDPLVAYVVGGGSR